MINAVPPAAIFIIGAFLIPLLRGNLKTVYLLLLPVLGFINLLNIPYGSHWSFNFLDYTITFLRVDRLSLVFAYIFHIPLHLLGSYGCHCNILLYKLQSTPPLVGFLP